MENAVSTLIDALGGTTAVATLTKSKPSTVHSWRRNGITESRLDHLRLAARENKPDVPFDVLAAEIVPIDRRLEQFVPPSPAPTLPAPTPDAEAALPAAAAEGIAA